MPTTMGDDVVHGGAFPVTHDARRRKTKRPQFEPARFLNIDLDVRSRRSLVPLIAAWPWSYQPLVAEGRANTRWLIVNPQGHRLRSAEAAAKELLERIESLRGDARRCWQQAHRRAFDIGVQAPGSGRPLEEVRLTAETLRRIGAAGATVQLTVYPAEPHSRDSSVV